VQTLMVPTLLALKCLSKRTSARSLISDQDDEMVIDNEVTYVYC
jgi:hypothetical protein